MEYNKSMTATVYIVKDGKILLHNHKKYKTWFPVGGHLNRNEFPHQAAIREVKEETGLDITLMETENANQIDIGRVERLPLPFLMYREGDEEEFFDFIYIATPLTYNINPLEGESREFRWFGVNELEEIEKIHVRNTCRLVLQFIEHS